jgi:hypothetical protein
MVIRAFHPTAKARREPDAPVKIYLGEYSPFTGVKYYKLITDVDLALGRAKTGPVGWSLNEPSTSDAASEEGQVLAPA